MERSVIAREGRRAQALDALTFEREREEALRAQLQDVVLEDEGGRVDAGAFARMTSDDVTRVRAALALMDGDEPEDDAAEGADRDEETEEEILRLQEAIEHCRSAQRALERYVEALDGTP